MSGVDFSWDGLHTAEIILLNDDVRSSCVNQSLRKGRMCFSPETCVALRFGEA